jgi:hypothetical protein
MCFVIRYVSEQIKKMKKRYALIAVVACFALIFVSKVSAQENSEKEVQSMFSTAINVTNIKIMSQEGSAINLSFDIIGSDYGQSEIKYSAGLVKKGQTNTVDQKIFDDKIYVKANDTIHREFSYEAPSFLRGDYELWLTVSNGRAIIFTNQKIGDITLNGSGEYIDLNSETCYLTVNGDKSERKYQLRQGVDVSRDEVVNAVCTVKNNFNKILTVTPSFQNYYRTILGDKLTGAKLSSITLNPGEEKTLTFAIPKEQKSQAYDAVLTLLDENGQAVSSAANFHYVVQGLSATIQDAKLDKDNYKKGESAMVGVRWVGSADYFPTARKINKEEDSSESIELQIIERDGQACSEKVTESISELATNELIFDFDITRDCLEPKIIASIKDEKAGILDQASFLMVDQNKNKNLIKPEQAIEEKASSISVAKIIIIFITVFSFSIVLYMILKKKNKSYIRIIILLIMIGGITKMLYFNNNGAVQESSIVFAANKPTTAGERMCGYKMNGTKLMVTVNGAKKPMDPQKDTDCCRMAVTKTTIKNKKTKTTKECTEYIFGLEEPPFQGAPDKDGVPKQIADPFKRFPLPNTAPGMAGDRYNMYAMIYSQYLTVGQTLDTKSYFENYNDRCMNIAPHSAYYRLDVSVPNSEGIENEKINKLDGFNYWSYTDPSFVLNYQPKEDAPYYTAKFHGTVYIFVECLNYYGQPASQSDFDNGWIDSCEYRYNECYQNVDDAKQCAEKLDAKNLPGCDYRGRYCRKYEGSAEIPFSLECKDGGSSTATTISDVSGDIHKGDSYELKCTYPNKLITNKNWVGATSSFGADVNDCTYTSGEGTKDIYFQCAVPSTADAGNVVTNKCKFLENAETGYTCGKEASKTFTISTCECDPSDPLGKTVCPWDKYTNSCGLVCPGAKPDCGSCTPSCGGSDESIKHCGRYADINCHNEDFCEGTKPESDCPAGWKEISPQ